MAGVAMLALTTTWVEHLQPCLNDSSSLVWVFADDLQLQSHEQGPSLVPSLQKLASATKTYWDACLLEIDSHKSFAWCPLAAVQKKMRLKWGSKTLKCQQSLSSLGAIITVNGANVTSAMHRKIVSIIEQLRRLRSFPGSRKQKELLVRSMCPPKVVGTPSDDSVLQRRKGLACCNPWSLVGIGPIPAESFPYNDIHHWMRPS